jgi:predicted nucleic acid-binding protein
MNDYIVDASVVIQHFIADTYTANADALFSELGSTLSLYMPEFCLLECANVLWKQVRFQGLAQSQAEKLLADLIGLPLTIAPVSGLLARALQIGLAHQLAVYDSVYIAVAERLGFPLITIDGKQESAAKAVGVSLKPVTDFTP